MVLRNAFEDLATEATLASVIQPGDVVPAEDAPAIRVRAMPTPIDRISFAKKIDNNVDRTWASIVAKGAGQSVNQASGNLVITSGTTARAETIIRSVDTFSGDLRIRARSFLSQRIANQNFIVELVDVVGDGLAYSIGSATAITVTFPSATLPDGSDVDGTLVGQSMTLCGFSGTGTFLSGRYPVASVSGLDVTFTVAGFAAGSGTVSVVGRDFYRLYYDATTATSMKFDTGRSGYATGDTAVTINSSNSPGHLAIVTGKDLVATVSDQLVASGTAIAQTYRGSRAENVPTDKSMRLQLRVLNGATAPVSNSTWTVGLISVSELISQDVTVQDVRPMNPGVALPVEVMRTVTTAVSGTVTVTPANPAAALTGDTGAKTATGNGATLTNAASRGAHIVINVGAVTGTTPTLTVKVQGSADSGTTWVDLPGATTAAITASGAYGVFVSPGSAPVAGVATAGTAAVANITLPRTWRIVWTITGTTPSFTLTNVQVAYIQS